MARAASETKSLPKPAKVVRSLSVDIGKQICIFYFFICVLLTTIVPSLYKQYALAHNLCSRLVVLDYYNSKVFICSKLLYINQSKINHIFPTLYLDT